MVGWLVCLIFLSFFLELASAEQHHRGNSSVSASAWQFAWSIPVLGPLFALPCS